MDRWTIKALADMDSIQFTHAILTERLDKVSPYSPLGVKLRTACSDLKKLEVSPTAEQIHAAEKVLSDNGIATDEVSVVLQAIGYCLLDRELYKEEKNDGLS